MPETSSQDRCRDLVFRPLARPVRVTGRACGVADFVEALGLTLNGWTGRPSRGGSPFCTVRAETGGRYTVMSEYLDDPIEGLPLASAVCAVLADMSEAYTAAHAGMRALHCGAVGIAGRMVLFSGRGHAGKSTLVARLGCEPGIVTYCDDVLPIRPDGVAIALGVPPRLRLPLPGSASAGFRACVESRTRLRDDVCAYVAGPSTVPHGTEARPDVLLLLRREPGATPVLEELSPDSATSALLAQEMSLQADGLAHIDRVAAMAADLTCATFVYDDLEDAVRMLVGAFGSASLDDLKMRPARPADAPVRRAPPPADVSARWRRDATTGLRDHAGAAFLWGPASGRYYHLNPVALACWHLMDSPVTGTELARELCEIFPDVPASRIREDVAAWLAEMSENGLVAKV